MKRRIKLALYHVSKWCGLFVLASFVTRRGLRILCYHGFALSDESEFRPKLFIKPETFQSRMRYLRDRGYTVLSLEKACERLAASNLPHRCVVITVDDGFYSVFRLAWPVLQQNRLPATVYVTTYYVARQSPIFRLVVQYVFWKIANRPLELSGLGVPLQRDSPFSSEAEREDACWQIIRYGEQQCDEPRRRVLMEELCRRAGIDFSNLLEQRFLSLMSSDEIEELARSGLDIQLHTHRHSLPQDAALVNREISDNRALLQPLVHKQLHHLCYPSGEWSPRHWPWLQALGIKSATTCDPGLNYPSTPALGLKRFLDGENIAAIEFEAELSGFSEMLRAGRARLLGP